MTSDAQQVEHRRVARSARGRGRRVLDELSSTDDFTRKDTLSLADRKLILFLVVTLTDERECLSTAYEAVLSRWADDEEHWAYGKNLESIRKACSKYLGKSAEKRPGWRKIVDTIEATLPEDQAVAALATAAGLLCAAKGIERPDNHKGLVHRPWWAAEDVALVTVAMIRGDDQPVVDDESKSPCGDIGTCAAEATAPEPVIDQLRAENTALRQLLDTAIRAFRIRDRQFRVAQDAAEMQWSDQKTLNQRAREATSEKDQLRTEHDDLQSKLDTLTQDYERLLKQLHPRAPQSTLDGLLIAALDGDTSDDSTDTEPRASDLAAEADVVDKPAHGEETAG